MFLCKNIMFLCLMFLRKNMSTSEISPITSPCCKNIICYHLHLLFSCKRIRNPIRKKVATYVFMAAIFPLVLSTVLQYLVNWIFFSCPHSGWWWCCHPDAWAKEFQLTIARVTITFPWCIWISGFVACQATNPKAFVGLRGTIIIILEMAAIFCSENPKHYRGGNHWCHCRMYQVTPKCLFTTTSPLHPAAHLASAPHHIRYCSIDGFQGAFHPACLPRGYLKLSCPSKRQKSRPGYNW